ncbi:unnamed protein product [Adineta ricciae]|uniref:Coiled-coil domain-containing protein 178 n=1 Tax=Adineta ricciae TaxID=249248 RepID=A0A813P5W1_ADIRI|nr:unnamed protein product [Adineta ricciae]CAF1030586.1 unnamed protein product [Adineta ricciae]
MVDTETIVFSSASSDSGLGGVENIRQHHQEQNRSARSFDADDIELPANWPDYDFQRKKSCLFSRVFCTCVTKAINHLELVQNAIEQKDVSAKRGTTSKREVRFSQVQLSINALEIVGQGGHVAHEHPHHEILEDEVIDEVLLLLARLDRERLRLIHLCEHEQFVREKLKESIDSWRLKRLRDLPLAVQREHDACITDISELQWHITYNARLAEKMFAKVDLSRIWHQQLDIEVSNIRQTTDLIVEKVRTESIEIKRISDVLRETEHELMLSRAKNADVQEKAARANQRASLERGEMRNELEKTQKVLQTMTNKLHAAQDLHKNYLKTIADSKQTVKKNERTYKEEVAKRDAARAEIANCKLKLSLLATNRENIQFEIQRLTANSERARSEEQAREDERKKELAILEENALKRESKLEKILKKSKEKIVLIDEYERQLAKINEQIDRHQKTLERHEKQRTRDAEMLRTVTENLHRALYTNESITSDMRRETEALQKEEDGLRALMESLRRQIDDEGTMIGMIDEHLATDQRELDSINDAEAIRAEHAGRIETDLQGKYDVLSACVANLEAEDVKMKENLQSLKEIFDEINEKYLKEKSQLEQSRAVINEKHESTSTTANDLGSKLEHILTRSAYMKKHIQEMSESRGAMEVLTAKIRVEIQAAESELVDVKYNLSLAEAGEREVVRVLQQCVQRQTSMNTLNKHLFQERSNYQSEKQTAIENALALNTELAGSYRDVLYTYYEIKSLLMGKLEQRLDAVARVKDRRQLIELQTRLHDALNLYLGIKNEFVGQHLGQLNHDSHHNGLKLLQIQETVQSAIEEITQFLSDQVDFDTIHQEAMLKVHRDELKEKQNEQVPA